MFNRGSFAYCLSGLLTLSPVAALGASDTDQSNNSIELDQDEERQPPAEKPKPKKNKTKKKDDVHTAAVGLGLMSPEVLPVELTYYLSKMVYVRGFAAPPLPTTINVHVPSIEVQALGQYSLVTDATDVPFHVQYGPQGGVDLGVFPMEGSFFFFTGLSWRSISLSAAAQAPLKVVKKSASLGNVTSSDGGSSVMIDLDGTATTSSYLARLGLGWQWFFGNAYFTVNAIGLAVPFGTTRSAHVDGSVSTSFPPLIDAYVKTAMKQAIAQTDAAAEDEVLAEMKGLDVIPFPIIGIAAGFAF